MTTNEDNRYNGWTNYATWGVALVLSNDHSVYTETREQAAAFKSAAPAQSQVIDGIWTAEQCAKFGLHDWLKDYTEQLCGLERDDDALSRISPSMMAHQVISAGLADVDWSEIAANILSELDDE